MENENILESCTVCDFCGVENSVSDCTIHACKRGEDPIAACKAMKVRWFSLCSLEVEETCLLAGVPTCFVPLVKEHFLACVHPTITADAFEDYKTQALSLLSELIEQLREQFQSPAYKIFFLKLEGVSPVDWPNL